MLKLSTILITLSAIAKGFCDSIKFHPDTFPFQSDWWFGKGEYLWSSRTWLEQTIFSFVSDGWHCFDAIRIVALLVVCSGLLVEIWKYKTHLEASLNETILYTSSLDLKLELEQKNWFRVDNNGWIFYAVLPLLLYTYHGLIFTLTFWVL